MGLKAEAIDLETGDFTLERLEGIERTMAMRRNGVAALIEALLQQAELLWERLGTDRKKTTKLRAAALSGALSGGSTRIERRFENTGGHLPCVRIAPTLTCLRCGAVQAP
jgi:hypothetical protein